MKKILYFFLILIIIYAGLSFMGKEKISFVTSKVFHDTPERIFEQLSNYKNTKNWSPWQNKDTAMILTMGDITEGMGASYSWVSKEMGTGSQKTTACVPNQSLNTEINFKDWNSISGANFTLTSQGADTKLDWTYTDITSTPFYLRGLMFALNMEKNLKADYEEGLSNLENYLKKHPKINDSTIKVVK
jgi:Polyketide cyclase / dehydrase and lipid transport